MRSKGINTPLCKNGFAEIMLSNGYPMGETHALIEIACSGAQTDLEILYLNFG
jgi:hypothetical protein